jgi:RHS repeat-associated protein
VKIVGNKGQTRSCLGQTRLYIGCKGSSSRASVVISSREGRVVAAYHPSNLDFYFGFSTKYHDREVGLIAYQLRSYSPRLGRWLNRDPIEEEGGGGNLYQFNLNSPLVSFDTLGEKPISQCKLNGIPISFVFNGVTLTGNGFSTPAVSGRPVKTKRTSWVSTIKILGSPALGGIDSEHYHATGFERQTEG